MVIRLTSLSLSSLLLVSAASAGNIIDINQSGNNATINIEQIGDGNTVAAQSDSLLLPAQIHGINNTIRVKQGTNGAQSSGSVALMNVIGNSNYVDTQQGNSHWLDILVLGDSNSVAVTQWDDPSKSAVVGTNGDFNTVTINQKGTGSMSANVTLDGNGHTIDVIQDGSGNHSADISAHNIGGASDILLDQNGSTNTNYSIDQYCATSSGCGVVVTQY